MSVCEGEPEKSHPSLCDNHSEEGLEFDNAVETSPEATPSNIATAEPLKSSNAPPHALVAPGKPPASPCGLQPSEPLLELQRERERR